MLRPVREPGCRPTKIAVRIEGEACLAPTFGFLHPYSEHLRSSLVRRPLRQGLRREEVLVEAARVALQ
jgi:hypothetical protein